MKKLKLIYIEWGDAFTNSTGWRTFDEAELWAKDCNWVICEVGYVIKETKKYIAIAQGMKKEDEYTEAQFINLHKIPKTWIRKRRLLKV